MEKRNLADTIREITYKHLTENNGMLLGQAITAVGWINGTVPDCKGIVELPMTDVAGAGFAVGAAMMGRRPIFVVRFQDFLALNGSPLINYAAKCRELHGKSAPVFVRAIASDGLGPVHSGVLHSIFMHFPGFLVYSPQTPGEYAEAWEAFMNSEGPMLVSESRASYKNTEELEDECRENAEITLYGIASARMALKEAAGKLEQEGITASIVHLRRLKPFVPDGRILQPLKSSKLGLVVDDSFEICGASRSIAYELSEAAGCRVKALGLADRTKCLCPPHQNKTPDAQRIYETAKSILEAY